MPSAGTSVTAKDGVNYRLAHEIGRGGEGSVWSLVEDPSLVAKFYHHGIRPDALAKLEAMCRLRTDELSAIAAWPLKLLKEGRSSTPVAVLMRRVTQHSSVNQLYTIKDRLRVFPEAQFPFLLHTAMNTARAFNTIHKAGQVIGDVNHSNLMVSQKATVAMIDCDSFQVAEGTKTFLCTVGVPEFTPPELQGGSFAGKKRTAEHDAFGLAVLIFYMLFMGRHPFMGVFDTLHDEILSLDQAIAAFRFPYVLSDSSPEVVIPKYAPRLADYPSNVGALFKRAFTRDALTMGRPTAAEWVGALGQLSSSTKQCHNNVGHYYFSGLTQCPWCRFEGFIGTAIFGIRLTAVRDENFNLTVVWARIEAIEANAEPLMPKPVVELQSNYSASPDIAGIVSRRRKFRFVSISVVVLFGFCAVAALEPLWAVVVIIGLLIVASKFWQRGSGLAKPFYDAFQRANKDYDAAETGFLRSSIVSSLSAEKEKLRTIRGQYEALTPAKAKRMVELEANRRRKQLQHHLERFRIEDERIPMIGGKTTLMLLIAGIHDAWDIEASRIMAIKGFGPAKRDALVAWRAEKERSFKFNPNKPIDPRDILALDQEFRQKADMLKKQLNSGPEVLSQMVSVWKAQRRILLASLDAAAIELAKATVNRNALRGF